MLIDHKNEKLINAIIFFVQNTKFCGKTKLFKLLYFLDFEHFSKTGRNVTGLDYFAWPMGPVPKSLNNELESQSEVTSSYLKIDKRVTVQGKEMLDVKPLIPFNLDIFSKRELNLLNTLSDEYLDSYANDMIEATHLENLPWNEIYNVNGEKQKVIPYELALKKAEFEQVIKITEENDEFEENYK